MNKNYITIKTDRTRYRRIAEDDILYCKADGSYSTIQTIECNHLITKLLKDIESILVSDKFVRVNRSYIVNINKCIEYKTGSKPELLLCNKEIIFPSAKYIEKLDNIFCNNKTI